MYSLFQSPAMEFSSCAVSMPPKPWEHGYAFRTDACGGVRPNRTGQIEVKIPSFTRGLRCDNRIDTIKISVPLARNGSLVNADRMLTERSWEGAEGKLIRSAIGQEAGAGLCDSEGIRSCHS